MEPRFHGSPEQFAVLIEFMERHGDLARNRLGAQGRLRNNRLWSELTTLLNSVNGGLMKPVGKWQKVWNDWKTQTKNKYVDIKQYATGIDGGTRPCFTTLEKRVVAVIGVTALEGQSYVLEHGFQTHVLKTGFGDVDRVTQVPYSPPEMLLTLPSPQLPLPPSSPFPSFSSSTLPSPPSPRQSRRQPRIARQRSGLPRRPFMRNRRVTRFDRAMRIFTCVEERRLDHQKHQLDLEKRQLDLEKRQLDLEKRQLDLEERRLKFEEVQDRHFHELQIELLRINCPEMLRKFCLLLLLVSRGN